MPHRPIGSRWRCITDAFEAFLLGETVTVIGNFGQIVNRVRKDSNGVIYERWTLNSHDWELVEDAPQANPLAPPPMAPAAPQGAPIPAREQFTPRPDEQYIAVYRRTLDAAQRAFGAVSAVVVQSQFNLINNGGRTAAGTLEEIRQNARVVVGTNTDFDVYIIPLRAIEHWHGGVLQPIGLDINAAVAPAREAVLMEPGEDEDDDF